MGTIDLSAIGSAEAFGAATVGAHYPISTTGIGSAEAFGAPTFRPVIRVAETLSITESVSFAQYVYARVREMLSLSGQHVVHRFDYDLSLTETTSPSSTYMDELVRVGAKWFGRSGSTLYVADTFGTWTSFAKTSMLSGYSYTNYSIRHANNRWFVTVSNGSTYKVLTTVDFSSFTELSFPSFTTHSINGVAYGDGTWLLHLNVNGGESRFFTSTDLSTWSVGSINYNSNSSTDAFAVGSNGVAYAGGVWWLSGTPNGVTAPVFASSISPLGTFTGSTVQPGFFGCEFKTAGSVVFAGGEPGLYEFVGGEFVRIQDPELSGFFMAALDQDYLVVSDGDATQYQIYDFAARSWLEPAALISAYTGDQWWNSVTGGDGVFLLEYYDDTGASPEVGQVRLFTVNAGTSTSSETGMAFTQTLAETLSLADILRWGFRETLADTLSLAESLPAVMAFTSTLADTLSLTDTAAPVVIVLGAMADTLSLSDATTRHFAITLSLRDGLVLEALVEDDEQAWLCLALNTSNNSASLYEDYPFPHMAQFAGHTLLGNSAGIYTVGGTTDAGTAFHATAATGFMDFGNSHAKRLRAIYLGHSSEGEVYVGTLTGNDQTKRWYKLNPTYGDFETKRTTPALGVSARYWAIEVDSVEAFEIESIELLPVASTRRVRG